MSAGKEDDEALWRAALEGVRPVTDPRRDEERLARPRAPKNSSSQGTAEALSRERSWHIEQEDELVSGRHPDFQVSELRRLQSGEPRHEETINLRMQRVVDALGVIERAIPAARKRGVRCLLIVTGKGSGREGSGVIRRALPDWLSQGELARHVLAFTSAQPRDGGYGAYYVRLRGGA
ncbi:MAG: Smr/MutS family protein [Pseudomonadales bacterium]|jgi:DNA-nicking Smr family endonuclease|nr:Smr/MutS family protein [Pseudomonadales bacterium]